MNKYEFFETFHDEDFTVDLMLKMCGGLEESCIEGLRLAPQEALSEVTITSNLRQSGTSDRDQQTLSMGDSKEGNNTTLQGTHIWVPQDKDMEEFPRIDRDTGGTRRRRRIPGIHNQKERVRRERINERIKILHTLIPNSCKGEKVCMLEDAIQYIKSLQHQVQAISEWRRIHKSPSLSASCVSQTGTLQTSHMGHDISGESFGYGSTHGVSCDCSLSFQKFLSQSFASGSAPSAGVTLSPLPASICPSTLSTVSMNTSNLLYPPRLFDEDSYIGGES